MDLSHMTRILLPGHLIGVFLLLGEAAAVVRLEVASLEVYQVLDRTWFSKNPFPCVGTSWHSPKPNGDPIT